MARELDAGTLVPSGPAAWTDYLGTSPWGDFDLTYSGSTPVVSEQMRYLGTAAQQDVSSGDTRHYHGDLIGSTMLLTDEAGGTNFSPASFAYTAFGEAVTADGSGGWRIGQPVSGGPRYAYAGQWGYETWHDPSGPMFLAGANPNLAPIRLSHVGFRWYDAAIGRFVQRDPIGTRGGLNLYAYALNEPMGAVDPQGLSKTFQNDIDDEIRRLRNYRRNNWTDLKGRVGQAFLDGPFRGFWGGVRGSVGSVSGGAQVGWNMDGGAYVSVSFCIVIGITEFGGEFGYNEDEGWFSDPVFGGGAGPVTVGADIKGGENFGVGCQFGRFQGGVVVR